MHPIVSCVQITDINEYKRTNTGIAVQKYNVCCVGNTINLIEWSYATTNLLCCQCLKRMCELCLVLTEGRWQISVIGARCITSDVINKRIPICD